MIQLKVKYGEDPHGFYWPNSEQKRSEVLSVKRNSPADFESVYQCRPGQREGSVFLESDFAYYEPPMDLFIGVGSPHVRAFVSKGHSINQGWDTAFTATKASAYTAGITGLLVPCSQYHRGEDPAIFGPCEFHFDVLILDCLRQKLDWGDLVANFKMQHNKWQPETMIVEKKASGIDLFNAMSSTGMSIRGVEAKLGKLGRAILSVGAGSAQGWFRQHRVLFPRNAAWFDTLKAELKDFTGDDTSTTDQVDAIVHLIRHAIMQGSGGALLPSGWSPERGTPRDPDGMSQMLAPNDTRMEFLTFLGGLNSMSGDPFSGTCGRCGNYARGYCSLHKAVKPALDSCEYHVEAATA